MRCRLFIEVPDRGVAAATEVAAIIAPALGRDDVTVTREFERNQLRVESERKPQHWQVDLNRARPGRRSGLSAGNRRVGQFSGTG